MNNDEQSSYGAYSEEDEALFVLRMFRVMEKAGLRITESALSLFKPNPVLGPVNLVLSLVPSKTQHV